MEEHTVENNDEPVNEPDETTNETNNSEPENEVLEEVEDLEELEELEELSVHFIDVGQADATLFQFTHEGEEFAVLFDTGNWNRNDTVNYLHDQDISSLDVMIGSHPHADHIGQMDKILDEFDVGEVWMSGDETSSQTFERVLDAIESSDVAYEEPRAGDVFGIDPLTIEVFNPETLTGDVHEGSLTAKFTFGEVSFLLTGDAETQTEQAMITRDHDLSADVLQLGHHGSDTSTSSEFLSAVSPTIAIVSAGAGNQYGHPHDSVVERIQEAGVDLYGTHVNGTIVIETDGENIDTLTSEDGTISPSSTDSGSSNTEEKVEEETETKENEEHEESSEPATDASCIDINSATIDELQEIIHIGPARAEEMLDLRPFSSVDDMTRINGIAAKTLEDIKSEGNACIGG
ncbi:MBL fold metallo-hydrolase [Salipaludibacillus keqinensis]|uniref:MBL fold metallo-hydrolase n=2 Tax=Salipaludibacillus keqinensis TaxID=2045207 RepID=A0A323TD46_9BACI|nr:MBL fold metallo-hydrolase [Salipaludibacillus keqinensis]